MSHLIAFFLGAGFGALTTIFAAAYMMGRHDR